MASLAGVRESSATFREEKAMAALSSPIESRGRLVWRAPDHLEKRTEAPVAEDIVVDGPRLTYAKPSENLRRTLSLEGAPELRGLVEAVRGVLAGDVATLRRYYSVGLEDRPGGGWRLTLVPVEKAVKGFVKVVRVDGAGAQVRRVETVEPDGDTTTMLIEPAPGG